MNYNYTLKYRTFESLLEDVKLDLKSLVTDGSVDPSQLLKVATRINYRIIGINDAERINAHECNPRTLAGLNVGD